MTRIAKGKKVKKKSSDYKASYDISCGLSIVSRMPSGEISAVACYFCPTFCLEKSTDTKKSPRRTVDDARLAPSFRIDNIKSILFSVASRSVQLLNSSVSHRFYVFLIKKYSTRKTSLHILDQNM